MLGVLLGPACAAASGGGASGFAIDSEAALAVSRAAIGSPVADHRLQERDGRPVRLSELRGRPVVVSFVFTSCHGSCSVITRRLAEAVDVAREALGENAFHVITVGFDSANDLPPRMSAYARSQGVRAPEWRFLSADAATIDAFAAEIGFTYAASPRGFDHLNQTTVLDAEGRVYRQVYGDTFPTPTLVEPLKELVFGTVAGLTTLDGWVNTVRLICTVYDPQTGRYRFDYSPFIGAGIGILCLGLVAGFVVVSWRRPARRDAPAERAEVTGTPRAGSREQHG